MCYACNMDIEQIDETLTDFQLGTLRFSRGMFGNPRLSPRYDIVDALNARIAGDRSDAVHALLREAEAYYRNQRMYSLADHIKSAIESPH